MKLIEEGKLENLENKKFAIRRNSLLIGFFIKYAIKSGA